MWQYIPYIFFVDLAVTFCFYIGYLYYAIKLTKYLRANHPEKIREFGIYSMKFANSLSKDWPDIEGEEFIFLKNKAKKLLNTTVSIFLVFPVFLVICYIIEFVILKK